MVNSLNKTFLFTPTYQNRNWFILDCKNQKLGRLATIIAAVLQGKIKSTYCPSIDNGDYIILINANSIIINKETRHYIVSSPGRPGHSLKIKKAKNCLSQFTIRLAVKGMLPETKTKKLMRRLKIYNGQDHLHQTHNPIKFDVRNFYKNS